MNTFTDNPDHEKTFTLTSSNTLFQHIVNERLNNIAEEDENEEVSSIYDLGVNLEEVVEQILKSDVFLQKDVSSYLEYF